MASGRLNGSSKKKDKKVKNIYAPHPGGADDEEKDLHAVEKPQEKDTPTWHRHFEQDELLGRYEPIRELGHFCVLSIL